MDLNISALKKTLDSTNTSYKYLFFYALIKIINNNPQIKEITFNKLIEEMLILAWLPSFQFNLNFRKQDQTQNLLTKFTENTDKALKEKRPTNQIIKGIKKSVENITLNKDHSEILEKKLLRYVIERLVRPFYKNLQKRPESGKMGMYKISQKILNRDYKKEKPFYLIKYNNKKIILNKKWRNYIKDHFIFLELWILSEWHQYMQLHNSNTPSLYQKLKLPDYKRNSLDRDRKFWKAIIKKYPNQIKCIYSDQILTNSNFDIDHFICWNFLGHDEIWNLIPVSSEINRSKNNKVPNQNLIGPFINLKISSFELAKSILSKKDFEKYVLAHTNFLNEDESNCNTDNFKQKYKDEMLSLRNKAKNQGYEEFVVQLN